MRLSFIFQRKPTVFPVLLFTPALILGGQAYYSAAWQTATHSERDAECFSNLKRIWRSVEHFRDVHNSLPAGLADLPEGEQDLRCPNGCEYCWHGGTKSIDGEAVLCACPGHVESPPGWNLRRDPAAFVLLGNGEIRLVAWEDSPR